jgi:hypothetical protein
MAHYPLKKIKVADAEQRTMRKVSGRSCVSLNSRQEQPERLQLGQICPDRECHFSAAAKDSERFAKDLLGTTDMVQHEIADDRVKLTVLKGCRLCIRDLKVHIRMAPTCFRHHRFGEVNGDNIGTALCGGSCDEPWTSSHVQQPVAPTHLYFVQ